MHPIFLIVMSEAHLWPQTTSVCYPHNVFQMTCQVSECTGWRFRCFSRNHYKLLSEAPCNIKCHQSGASCQKQIFASFWCHHTVACTACWRELSTTKGLAFTCIRASTIWSSLLRSDSHWVKWGSFPKWRHFLNDLDQICLSLLLMSLLLASFTNRNDVNRSYKEMVSH